MTAPPEKALAASAAGWVEGNPNWLCGLFDGRESGYIDIQEPEEVQAILTACDAYPLALKLAEAAESMLAVLRPLTHEQEAALQAALDAFLAHRTDAAEGGKS